MALLQKWFEWSDKNGVEAKMHKVNEGGRNTHKVTNFYKMIVGPTEVQNNWFKNHEKIENALREDSFFDYELKRNFEISNRDHIIKGRNEDNYVKNNVRSLVKYVEICNNSGRGEGEYNKGKLKELKEVLLNALNEDNIHNENSVEVARYYLKNLDNSIENIIMDFKAPEYIEYFMALYSWATALYVYIYVALLNETPKGMELGYYKYKEDVREYEEEVLLKYGAFSNIGMEAIQRLAQKGNLVAMYELADQYFYGRTKDKIVNYNEAFKLYHHIAVRKITHPLACWSLAWMMLNYDTLLMHNKKIDYIEELMLNGEKGSAFYDELFSFLKKSYECGYAGAANLIGKILDKKLIPEEYIKASFLGKEHKSKKAIDFYKEALDKGYVYARNSIIALKQKEVDSIIDDSERISAFNEIKSLLFDSHKDREWWSTNQLGEYYRKGIKVGKTVIFEKDMVKAVQFYKLASEYIDSTSESNWPLTNYLVYGLYNDKVVITEEQKNKRDSLLELALRNITDSRQIKKLNSIK